jgi:hypothetical protein
MSGFGTERRSFGLSFMPGIGGTADVLWIEYNRREWTLSGTRVCQRKPKNNCTKALRGSSTMAMMRNRTRAV